MEDETVPVHQHSSHRLDPGDDAFGGGASEPFVDDVAEIGKGFQNRTVFVRFALNRRIAFDEQRIDLVVNVGAVLPAQLVSDGLDFLAKPRAVEP